MELHPPAWPAVTPAQPVSPVLTTSHPCAAPQASASELFSLWDEHCGRHAPLDGLGAVESGADLASSRHGQEPPQTPPQQRGGGTDGLEGAEGGAAGAFAAPGEELLLGDDQERRSWRRRLR